MQTRHGEARGALGRAMRRGAIAAIVPVALVGMLTACTSDPEPTEAPATSAAPTSAAPTAAPTPPAGQLNPEGSAAENKTFFDSVNQALIAANPAAGGVDFTSNLRTNGFDIAAMQVTPDITTVGVAADSIQFSVHWKDECLIGQYGQGSYTSTVMPVLGTGGCLIGQTRPIDW